MVAEGNADDKEDRKEVVDCSRTTRTAINRPKLGHKTKAKAKAVEQVVEHQKAAKASHRAEQAKERARECMLCRRTIIITKRNLSTTIPIPLLM